MDLRKVIRDRDVCATLVFVPDEKREVVGGRYELAELLGNGGTAVVHRGTDMRLGRTVAVKRLRPEIAMDERLHALFRREAQSSASLNHPGIVAVYDTGEEVDRNGITQPYIVMEYAAGLTLQNILQEGRMIIPERASEMIWEVLVALDYSHRAGVVHRDIKPGNVMITPTGDVKVMDFGIALAISRASSFPTAPTAAIVGTAHYLSPEQARGMHVDARSDIYSTGCLFYELLTGRPPFLADDPVAVLYQHVREPAVPPSQLSPGLDPIIDRIVMKALSKHVEDRYQRAEDMRKDIDRYLADYRASFEETHADRVDSSNETTLAPNEISGTRSSRTGLTLGDRLRRRRTRGVNLGASETDQPLAAAQQKEESERALALQRLERLRPAADNLDEMSTGVFTLSEEE